MTAAQITATYPPTKKNGRIGIRAPSAVESAPETAEVSGLLRASSVALRRSLARARRSWAGSLAMCSTAPICVLPGQPFHLVVERQELVCLCTVILNRLAFAGEFGFIDFTSTLGRDLLQLSCAMGSAHHKQGLASLYVHLGRAAHPFEHRVQRRIVPAHRLSPSADDGRRPRDQLSFLQRQAMTYSSPLTQPRRFVAAIEAISPADLRLLLPIFVEQQSNCSAIIVFPARRSPGALLRSILVATISVKTRSSCGWVRGGHGTERRRWPGREPRAQRGRGRRGDGHPADTAGRCGCRCGGSAQWRGGEVIACCAGWFSLELAGRWCTAMIGPGAVKRQKRGRRDCVKTTGGAPGVADDNQEPAGCRRCSAGSSARAGFGGSP